MSGTVAHGHPTSGTPSEAPATLHLGRCQPFADICPSKSQFRCIRAFYRFIPLFPHGQAAAAAPVTFDRGNPFGTLPPDSIGKSLTLQSKTGCVKIKRLKISRQRRIPM